MNWKHAQAFLAVAETGSLSAAAARLGQSQPTLGRQIKAAESALGVELFQREARGLRLTESGAALLGPARDMARAAAQMGAIAAGRETRLSGTVRITASVVMSHLVLPRLIAELRAEEPEIEIELVPSDASENLLFREADIAVRMFRSTQLDVVTRQVAEHPMALYGARALLARHGQPETLEALEALPWVGFDRSDLILRHMRDLGLDVDRGFFGVRCDDQAAFWRLVCAGCGIGAMQRIVGDAEPLVEPLAFQPPLPSLPVWLAALGDVRQSRRVRRVWDFLAARLSGG